MEVTVESLAKSLGKTVNELVVSLNESGLNHTSKEDAVTDEDKCIYLGFLKTGKVVPHIKYGKKLKDRLKASKIKAELNLILSDLKNSGLTLTDLSRDISDSEWYEFLTFRNDIVEVRSKFNIQPLPGRELLVIDELSLFKDKLINLSHQISGMDQKWIRLCIGEAERIKSELFKNLLKEDNPEAILRVMKPSSKFDFNRDPEKNKPGNKEWLQRNYVHERWLKKRFVKGGRYAIGLVKLLDKESEDLGYTTFRSELFSFAVKEGHPEALTKFISFKDYTEVLQLSEGIDRAIGCGSAVTAFKFSYLIEKGDHINKLYYLRLASDLGHPAATHLYIEAVKKYRSMSVLPISHADTLSKYRKRGLGFGNFEEWLAEYYPIYSENALIRRGIEQNIDKWIFNENHYEDERTRIDNETTGDYIMDMLEEVALNNIGWND